MIKINEKAFGFIPKDEIEESALVQIENLSKMPFIFKQLAIMPDCHCGHGAPVGTVMATKNALIPAAVGVDIGCGMGAIKTNIHAVHLNDNLQSIYDKIEKAIPLGAGGAHSDVSLETWNTLGNIPLFNRPQLDDNLRNTYARQFKTLGSGNHFIEFSLDEEKILWVVIHTGSRRLGHDIASSYMKLAQHYMKCFYIALADKDLAYLPDASPEFIEFVNATHMAQFYAKANRTAILEEIKNILREEYPFVSFEEEVNCHHNFTQQENHFNENVWVTRKGAIQLQKGQLGIIPGSMGTSTFIVEGKGNKLAFDSAPHGAGRQMSRKTAKSKFTEDDLKTAMGNILYRHRDALIDEIPLAYKDIHKVIEYSSPLLTVKHELKQILNIKGD